MRIIRFLLPAMTLLAALSCSQTDLGRQFQMERALNSANRLKTQFHIGVETLDESQYRQLEKVYQDITQMVSPPPDDSLARMEASEALKSCWQLAGVAFYNLGLLRMEQGDYDGAFEDFQKLVGRYGAEPRHLQSALMMQAIARYRQDRFGEAVLLFNRAAENYLVSEPQVVRPDMNILEAPLTAARILGQAEDRPGFEGQLDRSIRYYSNILDTYGNSPLADAAIGNLAQALLMGDRADSALAVLSQVRIGETGKNPPLVLLHIADIRLRNLNDPLSAENTYREFLEVYPEHRLAAVAQLGVGLALYGQGKFEKAQSELSKIRQKLSAGEEVRAQADYLGAICFERVGRWDRALGEYEYVATKYSASRWGMEAIMHIAEHYRNRSLRDRSTGEERLAAEALARAESHYRKLISSYKSRPAITAGAMSYLARTLSLQENWEEAARVLKSLAIEFPGTPEGYSAYLPAADILSQKLDNSAEAAALLRIFVKNYPGDDNVDRVTTYADSLEKTAN